ncbi:MAG: molybdate ABC transporter permease subunit [Spirochaeta sp.]|nr:molybdate ABC transporter permease subunit [Spirochaeta sp.]
MINLNSLLSPVELEALLLSIRVSFWAVAAGLPFGILCGFVLARYSFPGKMLVDGLLHLPLVTPPVVVGYLLLVLFGRNGIIGSWLAEVFNVTLVFTWQGAALASAVMAFPLMVRAIRLSIEAVDRRLEAAAATLGAHPLRVFFTITLPLSIPGVIAGVVLGFARSLGEFGATITFASNIPGATRTLPLALYTLLQVPGGEASAMRLAVISLLISILALVLAEFLSLRQKRRIEGHA